MISIVIFNLFHNDFIRRLITMIANGEEYITTLKNTQTKPTIKDLFLCILIILVRARVARIAVNKSSKNTIRSTLSLFLRSEKIKKRTMKMDSMAIPNALMVKTKVLPGCTIGRE